MGKQSEIVAATEGDNWHARNKDKRRDDDPVLKFILDHPEIRPSNVLEIGCGTGWRLERIRHQFDLGVDTCRGCDLSHAAILAGRLKHPKVGLRVATASNLGYPADSFDLVIFGFCLYLVDREELFQVVAEADRVLADHGWLVIHDFLAEPHSKAYGHDPRLATYKMPYHHLFTANPSYQVEDEIAWAQSGPGSMEGIVLLRKDHNAGWPRKD